LRAGAREAVRTMSCLGAGCAKEGKMNFGDLINAILGIVFVLLIYFDGEKAFYFLQKEVISQNQKGLSSLERFSEKLRTIK